MKRCIICGYEPKDPREKFTRERCSGCYQYLWRYGVDRIVGRCPTCGRGKSRDGYRARGH